VVQTDQESAAQTPTSIGWPGLTSAASGRRLTICGLVMVAAQVCLNTYVVSRGFFQIDDFAIGGLAAHPLSLHLLFQEYDSHLMPGVFLFAWLPVHAGGYDWGLWAGTLVIVQALAGLALLRALRTLVGDRMLLLIPLGVFLFTPMAMVDLTWWSAGIQSAPAQLALALAVNQHVRYVRTGRIRNAVAAFGWVLFGLAFYEEAVGIPLLLFALTSAFLVPGSWGQAARTTLRKHWHAWVLYAVAIVTEAVIYVAGLNSPTAVKVPMASNALSFSWDLVWHAFVPSAVGGPWQWTPSFGVPKAYELFELDAAPALLTHLSWVVAAMVVIASLWYRARAWRAWIILLGWLLIVDSAPVILGRVALFGPQIYIYDQYICDAAPVLAICLAIAFLPLLGEERPYRAVRPRALTKALVLGTASAVFLAGAAWSAVAYRDGLHPALTRSYLATASLAFSHVPADTVIYPGQLPDPIAWVMLGQDSDEQNALRPLLNQVPSQHFTWTTTPTGRITSFMIMNTQGQLVPAAIQGISSYSLGSKPIDCVLRPAGMRLKLTGNVWPLPFVMEIGYFAAKPVTLDVSLGSHQYRLTLPASQLTYGYLPVVGPGSTVVITPVTPDPQICIGGVTIGNVVPSPTGTPVPAFPAAG
jgi:hypothetical protein